MIYHKPNPGPPPVGPGKKRNDAVTIIVVSGSLLAIFFYVAFVAKMIEGANQKEAARQEAQAAEDALNAKRNQKTPEEIAAEAQRRAESSLVSYVADYSRDKAREKVAGLDVEWDWFPNTQVMARIPSGHLMINSYHPFKATVLGTRVRKVVVVKSRCYPSSPPQCTVNAVEIFNQR